MKPLKFFLIAVFLFSINDAVFSQQWQGTSFQGVTSDFYFANADVGLALVGSQGEETKLYKTTNKGSTWFVLYDGFDNLLIWSASMSFINSSTGWIQLSHRTPQFQEYDRIYKTTNAGLSWNLMSTLSGRGRYYAQMRFISDNIGFLWEKVYYNLDLFKTTNGGVSWFSVWTNPSGQEITDLKPSKIDPQILYLSAWYNGKPYLIKCTNAFNYPPNIVTIADGQGDPYVLGTITFLSIVTESGVDRPKLCGGLGIAEVNNNNSITRLADAPISDISGFQFSDANFGVLRNNSQIMVSYNRGVNWATEYTGTGLFNANIANIGNVSYCPSYPSSILTRLLGMNLRTYYDGISQPTTNAFTVDGVPKSTPGFEYMRGGYFSLGGVSRYINYGGYPYLLYGWSDNSTSIDEYPQKPHYFIWQGDLAAKYKGKMRSTSLTALGPPNQTKMIKDTVLGGVNTIHLVQESLDGGIFYTKSTNNGASFKDEEIVNFSDQYFDGNGNKNANLAIIRNSGNYTPITLYDAEKNVAAVWERYNSYSSQTEIKVSVRTNSPYTYGWSRYDVQAGGNPGSGNFVTFSSSTNFQSRPKLFVLAPQNNIGNIYAYTFIVAYLKPYQGQTKLMVTVKKGVYMQDWVIDAGSITDFAVTAPFNSANSYFMHLVYIKNNKVWYKCVEAGSMGGVFLNDVEGPTDLSTGVEVLQNKGEPDITLRNATNVDNPFMLLPVVTFKGQYDVKIYTQNEDGLPIIINQTYYPIVYREKIRTTTGGSVWNSSNFQFLASVPQQNPNIEGSKRKNAYLVNYSQNNTAFYQKVGRWNGFRDRYFCSPGSYTIGKDAKLLRGAIVDNGSTAQKLITLTNSAPPYLVDTRHYDIVEIPPGGTDDPDAITAVVISDNINYSFNLGSIIVNGELINFYPDMDSVIDDPQELNDNLKSMTFGLYENDTLIIGRDAFYLAQDTSNPFQEITYSVMLMNNTSGDVHSVLAVDTIHVEDSVQIEFLEGYVITNIPNQFDSFYVQMQVDTIRADGGDFGISLITGGYGQIGGGDNPDMKRYVFFTNVKPLINNNVPGTFALYQNFPNPFNPVTTIKFDVPKDVNVTIKIYDLLGREVTRLVNNELRKAGRYEVKWNAVNYASGVYVYRIEAGSFVAVKKMVLVK